MEWIFSISGIPFAGGGEDEADWGWIIGYYDGDGYPFTIQTTKAPSFSESAIVQFDARRVTYIFYLFGQIHHDPG